MLLQINIQKKLGQVNMQTKKSLHVYGFVLLCRQSEINLLGKLVKKQSVNIVTIAVYILVMCSFVLPSGALPVLLF